MVQLVTASAQLMSLGLVMQKKLSSLLRRSNTFGMSKTDIQVELDMIISDLISNVNRMENEMKESV